MIKSRLGLLIPLLVIPSFAQAFFCPTNFQQIDLGNSIAQVENLCGKPDKVEKKTEKPKTPEEWTFFIPQTVAANTDQQMQGTLKASVTFDKDGKAINLSVNGIGVGSSMICGTNITLGATPDEVKKACGTPAFINKQQDPDALASSTPDTQIVIFTYLSSTTPAVLTFENGILTKKD